ncbi:MAG TPA: type II toxin-antitoxin system HicA family toxin [Verrucomicrobiae bacterium]|nr:type II toxin-antitoxin system HicA family toxin [Verrucomicrobiae bacterium]
MALLPVLSGREVVKAFQEDAWEIVRQRGSHMILVKFLVLLRGSTTRFRSI